MKVLTFIFVLFIFAEFVFLFIYFLPPQEKGSVTIEILPSAQIEMTDGKVFTAEKIDGVVYITGNDSPMEVRR